MESGEEATAFVMTYIDKSSGNIGLAEDLTFIVAKNNISGSDNDELIKELSAKMIEFFDELYRYCRACRIHLAHADGLPLVPANFPEDAMNSLTEISTENIDDRIYDANAQAEILGIDYHEMYPEADDENDF